MSDPASARDANPPQNSRESSFTALYLLWTLIIAALTAIQFSGNRDDYGMLLDAEADTTLSLVKIYREWSTAHGGVYAPQSAWSPPNPYLTHPERDIVTASGKALTLINPAYMGRQVNALAAEKKGIQVRLVAPEPMNPQNAPDGFEQAALAGFERGETRFSGFAHLDGAERFRLVIPLPLEEGCRSCHSPKAGSTLGGAISVALPVARQAALLGNEQAKLIFYNGFFWVFGLAGIRFMDIRLKRKNAVRQKVEEALEASERRYRELHESMRDGFVVVDANGGIVEYNPIFREMLGYDDAEMTRLTYLDITPDKWRAMEAAILAGPVAGRGYSDVYEKEYRRKDGSVLPVSLRAYLKRDAGGNPRGHWALIRDISDLARMRDDLKWQLEVNAALAACTEAILAHDFSIEDVSSLVLGHVLKLTRSPHGFVASVDVNTKAIRGHTLTAMLGQECGMGAEDRPTVFTPGPDGKFHALYAVSVDTAEPFAAENPFEKGLCKPLKDGHIPITRFMSVPGKAGGKVRGLIALANGEVPYDARHIQAMERFAALFVVALDRTEAGRELVTNQAQLRGLLDAIGESAYLTSPYGNILFANETLSRRLHVPPGGIIGRNIYDLLPQDIVENRLRHAKEALLTGRPGRFEDSRDGHVIDNRVYPVLENGRVVSLALLNIDVTEARRNEMELKKFKHAVEHGAVSIVITGVDGNIEYVNPVFCRQTGYTREEALGQNPRILKSGVHPDEFYADMWRTIAHGQVWRGELCNKAKDGALFWERAAISPILDEKGAIANYIAVKEDVTNLRKYDELKQDVDRIMRHDLKTPLNGIIGLPQIMMDDPNLTGDQRESLAAIEASGVRMLEMIDNSLDLFKMETGAYVYRPRPVNALLVLRGVSEALKARMEAGKVRLDVAVDGHAPAEDGVFMIQSEERLFYAMLSNLLKNAAEASAPGDAVLVELSGGNPKTIAVTNRGAVPKDMRAVFFRKYATAGKRHGTGLGTYSAKLRAAAMGYSMDMETSDEENRTRIVIAIPPEQSV